MSLLMWYAITFLDRVTTISADGFVPSLFLEQGQAGGWTFVKSVERDDEQ
jgi:hypothetical protein